MSALPLSVLRFFSHRSRRRRPLPDPTMMTEIRVDVEVELLRIEGEGRSQVDKVETRISSEPERRSVGELANFPKSSDSINFPIVSFLSFKANCLH